MGTSGTDAAGPTDGGDGIWRWQHVRQKVCLMVLRSRLPLDSGPGSMSPKRCAVMALPRALVRINPNSDKLVIHSRAAEPASTRRPAGFESGELQLGDFALAVLGGGQQGFLTRRIPPIRFAIGMRCSFRTARATCTPGPQRESRCRVWGAHESAVCRLPKRGLLPKAHHSYVPESDTGAFDRRERGRFWLDAELPSGGTGVLSATCRL